MSSNTMSSDTTSPDTSVAGRQAPRTRGDDGPGTRPPPSSNGSSPSGPAPATPTTTAAPTAPGRTGAGQALHERLLEPPERDRLRALEVVTNPRAELYLAVLSAMVAARAAYTPQLRTEELLAMLPAGLAVDFDRLVEALDYLDTVGCVGWTPDTRHVQRKEDMYRRRARWHLRAAGVAAYESALAVLGAVEAAGGLRGRLFEGLRRNLELLLAAVRAEDAGQVYELLRALDHDLGDLTRSAQDFSTRLAELTSGADLDAAVFLDCKELLLSYLSAFSDDLYRLRPRVAALAAQVTVEGVDRLVRLAAAGDDGADAALGLGTDLEASWRSRWAGLERWLTADADGRSGLDELFAATTRAVRDVLAQIRRLSEADSRPVNRTWELLALARWFARCPDDTDAHALFDAAFGLGRTPRVGGLAFDPSATGPRVSWWDAEPAEIPVALRRRGQLGAPGRVARAADFSAQRAALAAEAELAEQARGQAAKGLASGPLAGRVLERAELDLLLDLVDQCLVALPPSGGEPVLAAAEGVTVRARHEVGGCLVRSVDGELHFPGLVIEVLDTGGLP